jgi:hypothetical protein
MSFETHVSRSWIIIVTTQYVELKNPALEKSLEKDFAGVTYPFTHIYEVNQILDRIRKADSFPG